MARIQDVLTESEQLLIVEALHRLRETKQEALKTVRAEGVKPGGQALRGTRLRHPANRPAAGEAGRLALLNEFLFIHHTHRETVNPDRLPCVIHHRALKIVEYAPDNHAGVKP